MNIFLKYIKDGKKLDMLLSNIGGPQQSMSCAIKKKKSTFGFTIINIDE